MAGKQSILLGSAGDRPTAEDTLGFRPYVESIATFLESKNTQPPLVISIEGEWGSGKSSFLRQLKERLAGPPRASQIYGAAGKAKSEGRSAIWAALRVWVSGFLESAKIFVEFNAWRHDKEDALWAAFALACTRQLRDCQPLWRRIEGYLKLLLLRIDGITGLVQVARLLVLTILWLALLVGVPSALLLGGSSSVVNAIQNFAKQAQSEGAGESKGESKQESSLAALALALAVKGGTLGIWVGALLLGGSQLKKLGNPLETDLQKLLSKPDYEGRTAFVERFHRDFAKILDAYCDGQRVYVFIDDLDRCEVPKAANLMQAINLMISDDPRLVFIIGMDREKVAASVVAKYASVLKYLDNGATGAAHEKLHFGYQFLEKFVQIAFKLPRARLEDIDAFARKLGTPATPGGPASLWKLLISRTAPVAGQTADAAGLQDDEGAPSTNITRMAVEIQMNEDSDLMIEAIRMVAPVLSFNPRRIKHFVNVFRLSALIANNLGLFDEEGGRPLMTFPQLAKFVAISMNWPIFVQKLEEDKGLLARLFEEASRGKDAFAKDGWLRVTPLVSLLKYGCVNADGSPALNAEGYSLDRLDVESLLAVTRPTLRRRHAAQESAKPEVVSEASSGEAGRAIAGVNEEFARLPIESAEGPEALRGRAAELAMEYENTRKMMPAGDERTAKMTAIVRQARSLASRSDDPEAPTELFAPFGPDGARVVALGMAQALPRNSVYLEMALETIIRPRSAFEQFQGLSLAERLATELNETERIRLYTALNQQETIQINEQDPSRWNLRNRILTKLQPIERPTASGSSA